MHAVFSPVGYHAMEVIEQAPRLDTLAGKKAALVAGSFVDSVMNGEIRLPENWDALKRTADCAVLFSAYAFTDTFFPGCRRPHRSAFAGRGC